MVRKSAKKVGIESNIRTLHPRDTDTKYMGDEPMFTIQPDMRGTALAASFTWYNRFYGRKEAKELISQYLDIHNRPAEAKLMRKVDEALVRPTVCWLARMSLRGLQLTEHEEGVLEGDITRILKPIILSLKQRKKVVADAVKESNRPNVQEIMKERTREAAGELEGMLDDYIAQGAKAQYSFKPMDEVAKRNILPQHISIITDIWKKKQAEFTEALKGEDAYLVESYMHLSKTQLKNLIKFTASVISDLNSYISVKKAAKAPRARKVVSVDKQVSKLKYLRTFKDPATKLDLTSVSPTKLHGASEAWVYDTAKRKLHHYIADEYSKTFSVKGNTLLGFDTKNSHAKTLRKPTEQLKEIMGSKPTARKYFTDIKAVSITPNGRFNAAMIILRAF